jgi:replicative DNA helicase
MGMTIDEVLARLDHVKKHGTNQWKASCPCRSNHKHGDSTPSLSVRLDNDGRIKVYCHVGCTLNDICTAIGCNTTDLLPDKAPTDRKQSLIKWYADQNGLKFVREYSYCYGEYDDGLCKLKFTDASGNKTFRWMKIDGSKPSGYAFSHEGCPDRLYIAGDPAADTVYLCEGEKDADTIHKLTGCTAASVEHGATKGDAGAKWHEEYERQLKDKKVFILFDNDEAGRKLAEIEAQKLSGIAHVYTLDLPEAWPECPEKGDISDAVKIIGEEKTKIILSAMTEKATEQKPEAPAPTEDPFLKFIRDVQTEKYKPVKTGMEELDELLGGGILKQSLMILLAAPSAGKTSFSQQLLETMAENKHDVIFMNLEMSREQLYARSISRIMRKQGCNMSASGVLKGYSWTAEQKKNVVDASVYYAKNIHRHMTYNPEGMTTDIEAIRETLFSAGERARASDPEASGPIVCLDYLHLVSSAQVKDGSEIIKQTVATLKEYATKYNTIVLLISASNRASNASGKQTMESGRDTSAVEYSADYLLGLTYKALDEWNGKAQDKPKLEQLQQQTPRKMVLKLMKNRLDGSGKKIYLDFDAAHSEFTYAGKPNKDEMEGYTQVEIDEGEIFDYDETEEI